MRQRREFFEIWCRNHIKVRVKPKGPGRPFKEHGELVSLYWTIRGQLTRFVKKLQDVGLPKSALVRE